MFLVIGMLKTVYIPDINIPYTINYGGEYETVKAIISIRVGAVTKDITINVK